MTRSKKRKREKEKRKKKKKVLRRIYRKNLARCFVLKPACFHSCQYFDRLLPFAHVDHTSLECMQSRRRWYRRSYVGQQEISEATVRSCVPTSLVAEMATFRPPMCWQSVFLYRKCLLIQFSFYRHRYRLYPWWCGASSHAWFRTRYSHVQLGFMAELPGS